MIACVDVDYRGHHARAACVAIERWSDGQPKETYLADLCDIAPYEPGYFYRRELPCLLAVLRLLPFMPEIIVIDGYVWVAHDREGGLGLHLFNAFNRAFPVIGVAKTEFTALSGSPLVAPVLRGQSRRPLYVTSIGIALDEAAMLVREMPGAYRIPAILRLTDRLARSKDPISKYC